MPVVRVTNHQYSAHLHIRLQYECISASNMRLLHQIHDYSDNCVRHQFCNIPDLPDKECDEVRQTVMKHRVTTGRKTAICHMCHFGQCATHFGSDIQVLLFQL